MIRHYFTSAYRQIQKYRFQSFIAVMGLGIGLFCFSVCMYYYRFVMQNERIHPEQEMMYKIVSNQKDAPIHSVSFGLTESESKKIHPEQLSEVLDYTFVPYDYTDVRIYEIETEERKRIPMNWRNLEIDHRFLSFFGIKLLQGDSTQIKEHPCGVLLSRRHADRLFGKGVSVLGRKCFLSSRTNANQGNIPEGGFPYTIMGVIEDIPSNSPISYLREIDVLTINDDIKNGNLERYYADYNFITGMMQVFLKLKSKEQCEQLKLLFERPEYESVSKVIYADNSGRGEESITSVLVPIKITANDDKIQIKLYANIVAMIGVMILLVSMLNFFYFVLGAMLNRRKEYSIRKTFGARFSSLTTLFFVQLVLLMIPIFAVSMVATFLITPMLNVRFSSWLPEIPVSSEIIFQEELFYFGISIIISLVIALIVAVYIDRKVQLIGISGEENVGRKHQLRIAMQSLQFVISLFFLGIGWMMFRQAENISDIGFSTLTTQEKCEIVELSFSNSLYDKHWEYFVECLRKEPSVAQIATSKSGHNYFSMYGATLGERTVHLMWGGSDYNYLPMLKADLATGRYVENEGEIVIDTAIARKYQLRVGMELNNSQLNSQGNNVTTHAERIVGIVNAIPTPKPLIGQSLCVTPSKELPACIYVKAKQGEAKAMKAAIRKIQHEVISPLLEPEMFTLEELIEKENAMIFLLRKIFLLFGLLALLITLSGVYATITLDTDRRRREVALRKIHGAKLRDIILIFAKQYYLSYILGITLVLPLLYLAKTWNVVAIFSAFDFLMLFFLVALFVLLTIIGRILKIARMNPAEVIKKEQ